MASNEPGLKYKTHYPEEWTDGTALHTSGAASGANDSTDTAWLLFNQCLNVFSKVAPLAGRKCEADVGKSSETLKELLQLLFLWGESFRNGKLGSVLGQSKDLKENVLDLLIAVSEIVSHKLFSSLRTSATPEEQAAIQALISELDKLVEEGKAVTSGDDPEEEQHSESLPSEDGFTAWDDARIIQSLETAISCLMELLPSMDRALKFANIFVQHDQSPMSATFLVSGPPQRFVRKIHKRFQKADKGLLNRLGEVKWQMRTVLRARIDNEPLRASSKQSEIVVKQKNVLKPEEFFDKDPFTCGICGRVLHNIRNESDWKRHVFADLRPYICTFPNCNDGLLTFPTRELWEEHEFGQHRVEKSWVCPYCPQKLLSPHEWVHHLDKEHRKVLSKQQQAATPQLFEISQVTPIKLQVCPLCLEELDPKRRTFVAHVARHMEDNALMTMGLE